MSGIIQSSGCCQLLSDSKGSWAYELLTLWQYKNWLWLQQMSRFLLSHHSNVKREPIEYEISSVNQFVTVVFSVLSLLILFLYLLHLRLAFPMKNTFHCEEDSWHLKRKVSVWNPSTAVSRVGNLKIIYVLQTHFSLTLSLVCAAPLWLSKLCIGMCFVCVCVSVLAVSGPTHVLVELSRLWTAQSLPNCNVQSACVYEII